MPVIVVIRTHGNPLRSHPNPVLAATSLAVVIVAAALPFSPIGTYFGFVAPPPLFFVILLGMVLSYLLAVEWVKRRFYRRFAFEGESRAGWRSAPD
jgi:Mg2+-importing ATPase